MIEHGGRKLTVRELAARLGMSRSTLRNRLLRYPVEIACQRSVRVYGNGRRRRADSVEPRTVLGEWLSWQKGTDQQPFKPVHPILQAQLRELRRLWEG